MQVEIPGHILGDGNGGNRPTAVENFGCVRDKSACKTVSAAFAPARLLCRVSMVRCRAVTRPAVMLSQRHSRKFETF